MRAIDKNSKLTRKELFKLAMVFFLNTLMIIGLMCIFLVIKCGGVKDTILYIAVNVARVLFVFFSVLVMSTVMLLYVLNQNKKIAKKPKNATMIFGVIALSLIFSYAFGGISVYLRPVSLCA